MKVKGDKVYFEADDYKLAKELLNKHVVIHADGTGPFGEDEGAHVSGMDVDYADNIENYEGLKGKGWDELDDEEQSWFDGEDDFEQLNPFWADDIVCIDKDLGQSGINWCDWEMIYADLWVKKEDYDKVNKVHTVHYDMEVENTKQRSTGMLLSEAKEILKKNGYYLVEDTDDSVGMSLKDKLAMAKKFNDGPAPANKPAFKWTSTRFYNAIVDAVKARGLKAKRDLNCIIVRGIGEFDIDDGDDLMYRAPEDVGRMRVYVNGDPQDFKVFNFDMQDLQSCIDEIADFICNYKGDED